MKNVVIKNFESFNHRRYSNPWVAAVIDGKYDFSRNVGGYTGRYNGGEAGSLYISEPAEGQIYGYGQKDRRGGNTTIEHMKYINGEFVGCDKLGN